MSDYNGYEEYHCWVCNKCGQIHYSEEIMKKHIFLNWHADNNNKTETKKDAKIPKLTEAEWVRL